MDTELMVTDKEQIAKWQEVGSVTIRRAKELASGIKDSETLNAASEFMLDTKRKRRAIEEWNAPAKRKAMDLLQELRDREKMLTEPMERAEVEILKPAIARFNHEQERKRRELEDKMRAEAKQREEEERLKEAQRLEDQGDNDMADAVLDAPVTVAPVVLPRDEQPTGISYRDVWKFRITNPKLIPDQYKVIDEKAIGGVVRALKGETNIPGVEVYAEKTVAARA